VTRQTDISIATSFQYQMPLDRQIPCVAQAGFSSVSLGGRVGHSGYPDRAARRRIKSQLAECSLGVASLHAPPLDGADAARDVRTAIEAAADFGARFVVAHAGPFACGSDDVDRRLDAVLAACHALAPVLDGCGVRLAIENVLPGPATELARRALHRLDPARFGLCYDSSHDQIDGPRPFDLIDEFAGRIFMVHLSDRIRPHVDHVIPGEGFIDWPEMCNALRQAEYRGPVLMEVMMQHSRHQDTDAFLSAAYAAGLDTQNRMFGRPTSIPPVE